MPIALNDGSTSFSGKDITSSVSVLDYTANLEYVVGVRVDIGDGVGLLNTAASVITIKAKITNTDGDVVEAYPKSVVKAAGETQLIHNFDRTIYLQEGEVLAVWVESDNANDTSIAGNVYILGVRGAGGSAIISMERSDISDWLATEFAPLTLATPADTITQVINNAIRYWNTHSAQKISRVYDYAAGTKRIQLDTDFKGVVNVYPTLTTTWIWNDHPLWTLLGITVLDNITSDLILMSEAFRNYRIYVGTDFRWTFERSSNPAVGGYLYAINTPPSTQALYVVGTRRIKSTEEINDEYILQWVLEYSRALLKIIEGNTLRKGDIVGIKNDGQELVNEGKDEKKTLEESLAVEGRWVAFVKRA